MNPGAKDLVSLFKSVIGWLLSRSGLVWLVAVFIVTISVFIYPIIQNFNFNTVYGILHVGTVTLMILYGTISVASYMYHETLKKEDLDYSTWLQNIQTVPRWISTWFLPLTSILLVVVSQIATIPGSQNNEITFREFKEELQTLSDLTTNMEEISSPTETTKLKEAVNRIMQPQNLDNEAADEFMNQIQIVQKLAHQITTLQQFVDQAKAEKTNNPPPGYAYLLAFAFSTSRSSS